MSSPQQHADFRLDHDGAWEHQPIIRFTDQPPTRHQDSSRRALATPIYRDNAAP